MNTAAGSAAAGVALIGALGFALLCLGRAVRCSDRFFDALVAHVEAQRHLNRLPPASAAGYRRDRRAVAAGLLAGGWTVLGLGLVPFLRALLTP